MKFDRFKTVGMCNLWEVLGPPSHTVRFGKTDRWIAMGLTLAFLVIVVVGTKTQPRSWNDISRVASIESRVERGTWAIDDSPWRDMTLDRVFLNGHYYSDKMPLLAGVGAAFYAPLRALGLRLTSDCQTRGGGCAYYWLTLILSGTPAALMVGASFLWGRSLGATTLTALLGTIVLALGTEILPYSLVLNHHIPAAAGLFGALVLLTTQAPKNARWLAGVGFLSAFAVMSDPLAGFGALALIAIAAARFGRQAWYVAAGALPPVLTTLWLDAQITGTLIPAYWSVGGYIDWQGGSALGPAATGQPDDLAQYAFKMFVGAQGLFAYNPILGFGIAGVIRASVRNSRGLRVEASAIGTAALLMGLYLATRTGNLGGVAYGERYFVNAIPLVMAFVYFAPPFFPTRARQLFGALFAVALAISLFSSYQGTRNPWAFVQPPFHLTRNPQTGALGARWNVRLK